MCKLIHISFLKVYYSSKLNEIVDTRRWISATILIIFENKGGKLEVNMKDDTVWLTQAQMEILFDVKHATISEHISNIF